MKTTPMTDTLPNWFDGPGLDQPEPGRFFHTTHRYPIIYLQITKCGCTYLRNLIYFLDHGRLHPDSTHIHAYPDDFVKADLIPRRVLKKSPYLFAIIRDPVDRFLSLYFDKIADTENHHDAGIRNRVTNAAGFDVSLSSDLETHRQSCLKILDWFGRNLDTKDEGKPNPHWQRQSMRLKRTEGLNPHLLTLYGLSWQLPQLLEPIIPDIADQMQAVRTRNESRKPFTRAEIMTPELEAAVQAVYADDANRYHRISAKWGPNPERNT